MKQLSEIISILDNNKELFSKYGVRLIGVFGSYTKGNADKNSDLDLLIERQFEFSTSAFKLMHLEEDLYKLTGINVDLAIKESLRPVIGKYILKEVIKI